MSIDIDWLPKQMRTTAKMLLVAASLVGSGWFVSDRVNSIVKRIDTLDNSITNRLELQKVQIDFRIIILESRIQKLEEKSKNEH